MWNLIEVETLDDGRPRMALEVDGHRMEKGEFFCRISDPSLVYEYHYVGVRREYGGLRFVIVSHRFDREKRVKLTDACGNYSQIPLYNRTRGDDIKRCPDFTQRHPAAEKAEAFWATVSDEVKAKYKAWTAPCDWNDDGTPNFRSMTCCYGFGGFKEELEAMEHDYVGEFYPHPKFPREAFVGFESEEAALDAFIKDRNWGIFRWTGDTWEMASMKRGPGGQQVEIAWEPRGTT